MSNGIRGIVIAEKSEFFMLFCLITESLSRWQKLKLDAAVLTANLQEDGIKYRRINFLAKKRKANEYWTNGAEFSGYHPTLITLDVGIGRRYSMNLMADYTGDYREAGDEKVILCVPDNKVGKEMIEYVLSDLPEEYPLWIKWPDKELSVPYG